jgi:hypothetical protein
LAKDQFFKFGRRQNEVFDFEGGVAVRETQYETVVGPHGLNFQAALGAQFCSYGDAPRGVDAAAKRREDADAAIAQLVAANFNYYILIAGDALSGGNLILQIGQEIFGGVGVEAVLLD